MAVDDAGFQAALAAMLARVQAAAIPAVARVGNRIVARGMAAAPVRTGTLRRSIHMDGPVGGGGTASAKVGPGVIYARRVELGFMNMTDSLGRLYHQPPHPYFAPAVYGAVGDAGELISRVIGEAIGG